MKFLSIRDLRNHPGEVWESIREHEAVLTASGKPIGILVGVDEDDFEQVLQFFRRAKAQSAISRIRAGAAGRARLSAADIENEIKSARRGRAAP